MATEASTSGGQEITTVRTSLPPDLLDALDDAVLVRHSTRPEIIRAALRAWLVGQGFLDNEGHPIVRSDQRSSTRANRIVQDSGRRRDLGAYAVGTSVPADLLNALYEAVAASRSTRASLIRVAIVRWLGEQGFLTPHATDDALLKESDDRPLR